MLKPIKMSPRRGTVLRTGLKPPSSNFSVCRCPFCKSEVRAYWWSLAGCGKKCDCGAKFHSDLIYKPSPGTVYDPGKRKFVKEKSRGRK
tara:strand:+ start:372 stop:638 length:267 start_codon:yes stop_codon:yes gene_type:complete